MIGPAWEVEPTAQASGCVGRPMLSRGQYTRGQYMNLGYDPKLIFLVQLLQDNIMGQTTEYLSC